MKKKDNIFKELVTDKKLPEASKEELIADIEALKLASELVDLLAASIYLS